MSEKIAVTETENEQVVPNKEAYRELSVCVRTHLSEMEESDNPPKKSIKRLLEVQKALGPVKVLRYWLVH